MVNSSCAISPSSVGGAEMEEGGGGGAAEEEEGGGAEGEEEAEEGEARRVERPVTAAGEGKARGVTGTGDATELSCDDESPLYVGREEQTWLHRDQDGAHKHTHAHIMAHTPT